MINAYIIHRNGKAELIAMDYDTAPSSVVVVVKESIDNPPEKQWYPLIGYRWVGAVNMFAHVYQAESVSS